MDDIKANLDVLYEYLEGIIVDFDPDERDARPEAWDAAFAAYHAACDLYVKLGYPHPCEPEPEIDHSYDESY